MQCLHRRIAHTYMHTHTHAHIYVHAHLHVHTHREAKTSRKTYKWKPLGHSAWNCAKQDAFICDVPTHTRFPTTFCNLRTAAQGRMVAYAYTGSMTKEKYSIGRFWFAYQHKVLHVSWQENFGIPANHSQVALQQHTCYVILIDLIWTTSTQNFQPALFSRSALQVWDLACSEAGFGGLLVLADCPVISTPTVCSNWEGTNAKRGSVGPKECKITVHGCSLASHSMPQFVRNKYSASMNRFSRCHCAHSCMYLEIPSGQDNVHTLNSKHQSTML